MSQASKTSLSISQGLNKKSSAGVSGSRPSKSTKDGAPTLVVVLAKSKAGPPAHFCGNACEEKSGPAPGGTLKITAGGGAIQYNLGYGVKANVTSIEYNALSGKFSGITGSASWGPLSLSADNLIKNFLNSDQEQSVRDSFDRLASYFGACSLL